MLSYLHAFHAGNFADVHKHAALTLAVRMMQAKASAIACFDTHAGSASYDLTGERALKTGEAAGGIQKIWPLRSKLHSDDWRAVLDELATGAGNDEQLRSYPGSPRWFHRYLREQDTLSAFELHPAEGETLTRWAAGHPRVNVFHEDGLQGLIRHLPPRQPRLLVLTDPSYEIKSDYEEVAHTLARAWQKCRHGVYLIWYPVLAGLPHKRLINAISESPVRKVLCSEVALKRAPQRGMSGSGMLVVNPPWGFDTRLAEMMAAVSGDALLGMSSKITWLVPE